MERNYFLEGFASIGQGLASIGQGLASIMSPSDPTVRQTFRHNYSSSRSTLHVTTPEGTKDYSHVTIDSPEAERLALADILDGMAQSKEDTDSTFTEMNATFERVFGDKSTFKGSTLGDSAKADRARAAELRKGRQ